MVQKCIFAENSNLLQSQKLDDPKLLGSKFKSRFLTNGAGAERGDFLINAAVVPNNQYR